MAEQPVHEFALGGSPSAGTDVEDAFRQVLTGTFAPVTDRAMLLITELLMTEKSIRAGGNRGQLSVRVISGSHHVRVEVRDAGTGIVLGGLRTPSGPTSHGWSPHLLSRIADRWGLVSGADGAWVWFELDLPRA